MLSCFYQNPWNVQGKEGTWCRRWTSPSNSVPAGSSIAANNCRILTGGEMARGGQYMETLLSAHFPGNLTLLPKWCINLKNTNAPLSLSCL